MMIFGLIAVAGFVILLISLIFGHDVDVDTDIDVGHDFDFGHDVDHDLGGHTPSVFSVKMACLLAIGFGGAGFYAKFKDLSIEWSALSGIGGALVMAIAGYLVMTFFYKSQVSSTIRTESLIGCVGTLTVGIMSTGTGEVSTNAQGRPITYLAKSKGGRDIPKNSQVKITTLSGEYAIVEEV